MAQSSSMDSEIKEAKIKIASYCAYQERCHSEVITKLYAYGLHTEAVEELVAWLITENYLNEERFALTYSGGKFRIKKWGKLKIRRALEQKRVSAYSISKALSQFEERDYLKTISELIFDQQTKVDEANVYIRRNRIAKYLSSKGFEPDLVWHLLKSIIPD